jgi:STE24 endopeptidase
MNRIPLLVVIALSLVLSALIAGTAPVGSGEKSRLAAAVAPMDDAWRAALPRDPEAATKAYLARLSPEARARSDAYFEGKYWLRLWDPLVSVAILWLLLGTRCSAAMRNLAERITRVKALQTVMYALQFVALTWVIGAPLSVYEDFFREHQYGLANQSFWPWFGEQLIGLGVSLVLASVALMAIYAVIRRAPRTWWLWGSVVGLVFQMFVMLIGPVYIDPLFNTYKPLQDGAVKQGILSLARANGVPVDNVYEVDASKQTTRISANVSGFLGTAAVRLNDNLLKRTSPPEIRAVMAHEIGHYALNHIYKMLMAYGILLVAGFAFVRWGFAWAQMRWGERWGVRGVGDIAGLPLFTAVFTVYFFLMTPVITTAIRAQETEADLYGLNAAREADGFAEVSLKLSEYRKVDPGPMEEFFLFDHPSAHSRIFASMRWKAEQGK